MKKHLATITILTKDRHMNAVEVQKVLTAHGHLVLARLGVNPQRSCVKGCQGLITITAEGTVKEINDLTRKLDKLYGIVAKNIIITKY